MKKRPAVASLFFMLLNFLFQYEEKTRTENYLINLALNMSLSNQITNI